MTALLRILVELSIAAALIVLGHQLAYYIGGDAVPVSGWVLAAVFAVLAGVCGFFEITVGAAAARGRKTYSYSASNPRFCLQIVA